MMTHLTDVINMWVLKMFFLAVKDGNTTGKMYLYVYLYIWMYLYVYCLKFTALSDTNVDIRLHPLVSVRAEYHFILF